jgi:hypothetical protein
VALPALCGNGLIHGWEETPWDRLHDTRAVPEGRLLVQSGARRRSIAGTYGNGGTLKSVTYRISRVLSGSNPTLSANLRSPAFMSELRLASQASSRHRQAKVGSPTR